MNIILKILFLLTLNSVSALADSIEINFYDLQQNIRCSEIQDRTLELNYNNQIYQIALEDFYDTPVINPTLVCERYISAIRSMFVTDKIIRLEEFKDKYGLKIYHDQTGFLLKICLDLGYCSRGILDSFKVQKGLQNCRGKTTLSSLIEKSKPKLLKKEVKIIHDLEIKVHPFKSFSQVLFDYINDPAMKEVHASTMTLGNNTLFQLSQLLEKSSSNLKLSYDAGISLFGNPQSQIAEMIRANDNLTFLPLTSGDYFRSLYHIKFIASPDSNRSMMASMNLSSANRNQYIDFNYFFNDPKIRNEFLFISERNHHRYCEHKEDFRCLTDFYLEPETSEVPSLTEKKCKSFNSNKDYKRSGYFANSEEHDLKTLVLDFIDKAKEEIILLSYKLTDRQIADSLLNKQQQGLKVYSMLAYKSDLLDNKLNNHIYSGTYQKENYPFPHMKVIIVDRKLMLFGTANFTVNALSNTTELIGITDNQTAIKTALDYAAVFSQSEDMAISRKLSSDVKPLNYITAVSADLTISNDQFILPHTNILSEDWLYNYRLPDTKGQELINKCKLNHLHFITLKNYLSCLDTNKLNNG